MFSTLLRKTLLSASLSSLILAAGIGQATAAPVETVTNLNDSGAGSLRQALTNVNAGGTVTFNSSLSGTIDLQAALLVDKSVTIEGPGADRVVIDAKVRDNILVIGSVTPGAYDVVVEGLAFLRGSARPNQDGSRPSAAPLGGAIAFVAGDSLTVRDSAFRQNLTVGGDDGEPGGIGGAIGIACQEASGTGASLSIENSVFRRNSSFRGGGAVGTFSDGAVTISESEFETNTANRGGGALLVKPFQGDPAGCTAYDGNVAPTTSPVTVSDSLFETNGAVDSSSFNSNGAAISILDGGGPVTVTDSRITGSAAQAAGGAIGMRSPSSLTVEDSSIDNNRSENRGGGISYQGSYVGPAFDGQYRVSIVRSAIVGNTSRDDGSAIEFGPGSFGSEATYGLAKLSIEDSLIEGNTTGDDAPAVNFVPYLPAPMELSISGTRFQDNISRANSFGLVFYSPNSNLDLRGSLTIEDSDFLRNAGSDGGTTIATGGQAVDAEVRDVSVAGNAVGNNQPLSFRLSSGPSGGTDPSTYLLSNVTVAGNSSAGSDEGAILVRNEGDLTLEDSTVAMNSIAGSPFGSESSAGLMLEGDATATVRNSILGLNDYDREGPDAQGGDCFMTEGTALVYEGANLVEDTTGCEAATGPAPITGDPGFDAPDPIEVQRLGTDGYTTIVPLASDSPARGAALGDWPETDQRGAPRPETAADLGAVQYYEEVGLRVFKTGNGDGAVTSDLGGIDCGDLCEETYPDGTTVVLTASPDAGSAFTGWSGACTGTGLTCEVALTEAETVTANFSVVGPPSEQGEIRIRKAQPGPIKVGSSRTFAIAKVTCLVGTCEIERVKTAQVRIRQKIYRAEAIVPTGSFSAGESKTIKMKIPKVAFDSLKPRKSAVAAIYSVLVATGSGDQTDEKVFRSVKVGLRK